MQTELGVLPEDWNVQSIGGLQPFVTSGSRGWATFYSEYGSPFIRITNLSRESIYPDLGDLRFVDLPANDSEGARTQLHDGDVLISITADIGIVGHVTQRIPKPAYINQHIALIRFNPARTSSRFVSYFLASERPQKIFRALTDSGAKAGMNLRTVQQIKVALPVALHEQEAIAEAISDADALIESLEQLLAKKRQIKQGAMQELLTGRKRLAGFSGRWATVTFGEVAARRHQRIDPRKERQDFCVELEHIESRTGQRIGNSAAGEESSLKSVFQAGDVLFGKLRAYLRKFWLADCPGVCSTEIWCLMPHGMLKSSDLLFQLVQTDAFVEAASMAYGTHMPRSDWNSVKEFTLKLPTEESEQVAIATALSDMDADITALAAKLTKVRQLKQGMMQELLTGRIRLV